MSLRDQGILALTVDSPYGQLIAEGHKPVETRSWPPYDWMLGRYIAVHASTRWNQHAYDFISRNHSRFQADPPTAGMCQYGIIAVARLVGWVQRTQVDEYSPGNAPRTIAMLPGHGFTHDDWRWWTHYEYAWLLRDVKRIAPVACKGRQKLWAMSKPVYDSVRQQYKKAAA